LPQPGPLEPAPTTIATRSCSLPAIAVSSICMDCSIP
jgi:hypothetical protein